jgi:hypothetical protein
MCWGYLTLFSSNPEAKKIEPKTLNPTLMMDCIALPQCQNSWIPQPSIWDPKLFS